MTNTCWTLSMWKNSMSAIPRILTSALSKQDYNQPMGVATYKVIMPEKLKAVMPDEKLLLEVM